MPRYGVAAPGTGVRRAVGGGVKTPPYGGAKPYEQAKPGTGSRARPGRAAYMRPLRPNGSSVADRERVPFAKPALQCHGMEWSTRGRVPDGRSAAGSRPRPTGVQIARAGHPGDGRQGKARPGRIHAAPTTERFVRCGPGTGPICKARPTMPRYGVVDPGTSARRTVRGGVKTPPYGGAQSHEQAKPGTGGRRCKTARAGQAGDGRQEMQNRTSRPSRGRAAGQGPAGPHACGPYGRTVRPLQAGNGSHSQSPPYSVAGDKRHTTKNPRAGGAGAGGDRGGISLRCIFL